MLNGLDLFSGIGGITKALENWVKPVAYCEVDRYAQAVLLSRMAEGSIPIAPIWDDVRTLTGDMLLPIDIIYGGFPCQDISVAGKGKGLAGERSGLFFEIMRLVSEIRPTFLFLENVPAITNRGLGTVTAEITQRGYDCRWTTLSAAEVGANHKRDRWWLLAYSDSSRRDRQNLYVRSGEQAETSDCSPWDSPNVPNSHRNTIRKQQISELGCEGEAEFIDNCEILNAHGEGLEGQREQPRRAGEKLPDVSSSSWWTTEPNVGRVGHGIPFRVDRIRGLGNAVVPLCAKEAFKELMGIK